MKRFALFAAMVLSGIVARADVDTEPLQSFGYGGVNALTVSSDGRSLVTAGYAGAFLWDMETAKVIRKFIPGGTVSCVALSPDGRHLVTGTYNWYGWPATATVWSADTGQILRSFTPSSNQVSIASVACSPAGDQVAAGDSDGTTRVWDVATGQLRFTLSGRLVEFSPNGKQLLVAGGTNTVLADAATGQVLRSFDVQAQGPISFSPDGSRVLLSGSVWDTATGSLISSRLSQDGSELIAERFSPDGTEVYSAYGYFSTPESLAEVWSAATGELIRTIFTVPLTAVDEWKGRAAFAPDGQSMVTYRSHLDLWDLSSGTLRKRFAGAWASPGAHSPDGTRVLTGGDIACLWDAVSGALLRTFEDPTNWISSVGFSPNGAFICNVGERFSMEAPDSNLTFRIWEAASGSLLRTLVRSNLWPTYAPRALTFSPDGTKVLLDTPGSGTNYYEFGAIVWDVASGQVVTEINWTDFERDHASTWAFSPDGREVLIPVVRGPDDRGGVLAFDAGTGKPTRTVQTCDAGLGESVCLSSDGRFAAVVGYGDGSSRRVRIWDLQSGHLLRERVLITLDSVFRFTLAGPQARFLIGRGYSPFIWDTETGGLPIRRIARSSPKGGPIVTVSPDGLHIITSVSGVAELWDLSDLVGRDYYSKGWNVPRTVDRPRLRFGRGVVRALAPSPDGKRVAVAYDHGILIWDVSTARPVLELSGGPVSHLAYSSDGTRLLGGLYSMRLWDAQTGELRHSFYREYYHRALALSPDGSEIVSVTLSNSVARVWDENSGNLRFTLEGVSEAVISGDARQIMTADTTTYQQSGTVRLWDAVTGQLRLSFPGHTNGASHMVFSPDRTCALTSHYAYYGYRLRLWNTGTGQLLQTFMVPGEIGALAISDDNQQIAVVSGTAATLWDVGTGQQRSTLSGHAGRVIGTAYLPGGGPVATGSEDGTVRLWDRMTGQLVRTLSGSAQPLMFSSDGQGVLVRSESGGAKLWDLWTGELIEGFDDYVDALLAGGFQSPYRSTQSPDGRKLLVSSKSMPGLTDLVAADSGNVLVTIDGELSRACFSPVGSLVVTDYNYGTALWDSEVGQPLRTFNLDFCSDEGQSGFSPNGMVLVRAESDGTVALWDLRDLVVGLRVVTTVQGRELRWEKGRLQEADSITGPWRDAWDASSPLRLGGAAPQKFYRVVAH